jgi:myo-inositol-1(or 4)-monophosphatase
MLDVLKKAARAGGDELKKRFGTALTKTTKTLESDFATDADHASERAILDIITRELPEVSIYSEETGWIKKSSEYTIYIDPLDGTHNFYYGIPIFTVSIALLKGEETIAGAVYNPLLDHLYEGERGEGSCLNNRAIRVNDTADLPRSTIALSFGRGTPRTQVNAVPTALFDDKGTTERYLLQWAPAYDICLVAGGKIAGAVACNLPVYDFLAAKLIAKEAGARVTHFGKDEDMNGTFVVSNPHIHEPLVHIVEPLV